ncbi:MULTISPECIES: 3-phosphoshikimate 1-carboxyvinyltransferase [Ehrlichia]|uniref:3-phosphoshikimate 1-carboxyvinyltransferase n=1 Tax=Ehrlichia cf. muris str. EmCRT TaxID=1359167 RepID=A0A0F3N6J0_9RICK|nr:MULTISPECIES: 3-phosphoshikimate 1-carboxyvinyltransferase [Ehrlichia]KJV63322.1 EPSP synthase family protein [Ehrlichia cf. muris str. EmCRT]OUC04290.1 3-phosphoshikimate 1-carboxyvinyltransferase [Ehrlichia sp. Wisconsin_h]
MVIVSERTYRICGHVNIVKDSLLSHVALILASQVVGVTKIYDIAFNTDIILTIKSLNLLGVKVRYNKNNRICSIEGMGVGAFLCPKDVLYFNDPSIYMMMGCLSNCPFTSFLSGYTNSNIDNVMKPLLLMGARFISNDNKLPAALVGCIDMLPIKYETREDEVKTAIMFAALNTYGTTTIVSTPSQGQASIMHMLRYFNVEVECSTDKGLINTVNISGQRELYSKNVCIPNDFFCMLSFIIVALILKGSEITILNVLLNNRMKNLHQILVKMGANLFFINKRRNAVGEEIVDLAVKDSVLQGVECLSNENFDIDEYLFMVILAAYSDGMTVLNGVFMDKRLRAVIDELIKCGVRVTVEVNCIIIYGCSSNVLDWDSVDACYDFKMTILFLVIGMISNSFLEIKNVRKTGDLLAIIGLFNKHGAKIRIA